MNTSEQLRLSLASSAEFHKQAGLAGAAGRTGVLGLTKLKQLGGSIKNTLHGQLEGFIGMNPAKFKHLGKGPKSDPTRWNPTPGTTQTSIPVALKQLLTDPKAALREGWQAMGPKAGRITGVHRPDGKLLPRLKRDGKQVGHLYPSLERSLGVGFAGLQGVEAAKAQKGERGAAIGGALATLPAMALTSRLPIAANLAAFAGIESAGRAVGGLFGRKERALRKLEQAKKLRGQIPTSEMRGTL